MSDITAALLLACLTATAVAQEVKTQPAIDTLEEAVVSSERERERRSSPPVNLSNPDVITITRKGETRVRLTPASPQQEIRFRRESIARQIPIEGARQTVQLLRDRITAVDRWQLGNVSLDLVDNIIEADGLPAVIPFGTHISLVNIDYVRLRDTGHPTLINATNAIHPQTRRCIPSLAIADDQIEYPNRFFLLGDGLGDCTRALRNREGDLFFADGVPERLRQQLRETYDPLYSRFAQKLGSEPGMFFVAWQPDSPRNDIRFERSWSRNNLLLFNGPGWQQGFGPKQRDALWETLALEQILRRIQFQDRADAFTRSAANYLLLLARSERDRTTSQQLTAELPVWISGCARQLNTREPTETPRLVISGYDCGSVLQFVYDAIARAESKGEDTVYRNWRELLTESFRRSESGVKPDAFVASSGDAHRIVQGLLEGRVDWSAFVAELGRFGVRLRIAMEESMPTIEVVSLTHFRD